MKNYSPDTQDAFISNCNINYNNKSGKLSGLTFAVKDNIDLKGFKTSFGSKPWLNSHPIAVSHALCVEQLLNDGATCVGKTVSDELTCSLDGESYFYGTPINPAASSRIPGGSSSGSASIVASSLVDFSLGTDSAGSIRVPASHCGVLGMRPTMHRISESGVIPFAPSSSTVGVFAKDIGILKKVASTLLSIEKIEELPISTIYLLKDSFSIANKEISDEINSNLLQIKTMGNIKLVLVSLSDIVGEEIDLSFLQENVFNTIQCVEIWNAVGAWIEDSQPEMGPRVKDAMNHFKNFNRTELNSALLLREKIRFKISDYLKSGELFAFPTTPMIAPEKGELDDPDKCMDYYQRTMSITSFSSIFQLPEISIPIAQVKGTPVGISFAANTNNDDFLLNAAEKIIKLLKK